MEFIALNHKNIASEHICCAISNNDDPQVNSKKKWLEERLDEGLVFLKADARGKCFIEYIPAEKAWAPVDADGYMFIDCFWVSGQLKGHGYGRELLERCISDSREKGRKGLCVISSKKKLSFLSDPKFLSFMGFKECDAAEPYFTLMYLPFDEGAAPPKFKSCAVSPKIDGEGFILYYSNGCPFNAKYVPIIENAARENDIPFRSVHIDSCEKARNAPSAWTVSALFYNGKFVTHEILSEKKFLSLAEKMKG
ncbi:MAG: N-acetyltransferase [Oscillospiraceae bacterium]|nr:N-acetyltransferase [Oscillospiraceae bacterium]